jgi:NADH dehydrogenase [ubiquinone] 1 alpha subcomplex assembly factor 7
MLKKIVVKEIRKSGFITFDRFVELSLYHPEFGYYTKKRVKNVLGEDFITAPELTSAFGKVLAFYIKKKSQELNLPLRILELGGGKGFLFKDITDSISVDEYTVLEVREKPNWIDGVNWISSLSDLGEFSGFIVANEFFDAFPFKRIVKRGKKHYEVVVTEDRGFLKEKLIEFEGVVPCSLDEGEEYPLFMWKDFLWELSEKIKRAYLIVFDYGDSCGELSFRAYRSNKLVNDYLEKIGETDLTASVDFTYLRSLLEKVGFKFVSLKPQSSFLLENGIERFLKPSEVPAALTLLVDMGRKFKVLEVLKELSPF